MVAQLKHTPNLTDLWRFELGGRQETKGKIFLRELHKKNELLAAALRYPMVSCPFLYY